MVVEVEEVVMVVVVVEEDEVEEDEEEWRLATRINASSLLQTSTFDHNCHQHFIHSAVCTPERAAAVMDPLPPAQLQQLK